MNSLVTQPQRSRSFVPLWITHRTTGQAFEHIPYAESLAEAMELARLTWYDTNLWAVGMQKELANINTNEQNPFKDSFLL